MFWEEYSKVNNLVFVFMISFRKYINNETFVILQYSCYVREKDVCL